MADKSYMTTQTFCLWGLVAPGLIYGPMELANGTAYLHMHFIAAMTWAVCGLFGMLMEHTHTSLARRGVAISTALAYHGYLMLMHVQANDTARMMHRAHGNARI